MIKCGFTPWFSLSLYSFILKWGECPKGCWLSEGVVVIIKRGGYPQVKVWWICPVVVVPRGGGGYPQVKNSLTVGKGNAI